MEALAEEIAAVQGKSAVTLVEGGAESIGSIESIDGIEMSAAAILVTRAAKKSLNPAAVTQVLAASVEALAAALVAAEAASVAAAG